MESIQGVDREVGNVVTKLSNFNSNEARRVREAADALRQARNDLQPALSRGGDEAAAARIQLLTHLSSLKEALAKFSSVHRDLHSSVSKVGKAIDRHFVTDYDSTSRDEVFADKEQQRRLNEVVLQHLNRQGRLDLSDIVADESGLGDLKIRKEPFQELNSILESLQRRDLGPALEWAQRNRRALDERAGHSVISHHSNGRVFVEQRSSLEMKLHRMQFIELLRQDSPTAASDAVAFSRAHFARFVDKHEREIQQLMGAVMFARGPGGGERRLRASPYAHLLSETHWHDIKEHFTRNACLLMGLPVESPLSVIVNAGCTALPALLNIKQVMQQRQVDMWNAKDELPIEIDLGPANRYHSLFACPILRHQSNDSNPPVRLGCGHVISRDALTKLTSGHKLKCPYCPVESNPADARQITF